MVSAERRISRGVATSSERFVAEAGRRHLEGVWRWARGRRAGGPSFLAAALVLRSARHRRNQVSTLFLHQFSTVSNVFRPEYFSRKQCCGPVYYFGFCYLNLFIVILHGWIFQPLCCTFRRSAERVSSHNLILSILRYGRLSAKN